MFVEKCNHPITSTCGIEMLRVIYLLILTSYLLVLEGRRHPAVTGWSGTCEVHEYGADFYRFLASFAVRSAQRIVPKLIRLMPVRSVVDFGCGQGAWLSVWASTGASVVGVDGPYVDRGHLLIDPGDFHGADLTTPIDLGRQFDLVQSLEVAEHLPAGKCPTIRRYTDRSRTMRVVLGRSPGAGWGKSSQRAAA